MDWKFWLALVPAVIQAVFVTLDYFGVKPKSMQSEDTKRLTVKIMALLMLLTWGAVAYDLYDRRYIVAVTTAISNEELADTIQRWLDNFHLRYQVKDREEASFSFTVQSDDDAYIEIVKLRKTHQQFIILLGLVLLEPESQTKIKSLPVSTQQWIFDQVATELLRQNVSVKGDLLSGIHVQARVPISELTEGQLMDRVDKMYSALTLVRLKLRSF